MNTKVLINGANGKMGRLAQDALGERKTIDIVGLAGRGDDLPQLIAALGPDVVLDFTLSSVVFENAKAILDAGVRPVIGTSGLKGEDVDRLKSISRNISIGGLVVPNFSVTAVLMMKYAKDAAKYLNKAEIIEYHHDKKEESPSGTSLRTAELLAENIRTGRERGHEIVDGSLGGEYQNIPIHSVRLPGFVATQEVVFGDTGEFMTLKSSAIGREAFKQGICLACVEAAKLTSLEVGLESVME